MDLSKPLAHWRLSSPSAASQNPHRRAWSWPPSEQSKEQWLKVASTYLPAAATAILVLLIAYQLAVLTWTLLPGENFDAPPVPGATMGAGSGSTAATQANYSALVQSHLFGEAPAGAPEPVVQQVVDAPDTTLGLMLSGVGFGEGEIRSYAIIASNRNQQKTYFVGQAIEGAGGATLHSVYGDRVLLNRGGRLETLRLPKELAGAPAPRMAGPLGRPAAPASGGSLRQVISENASRLSDVVRLTPHVEGNQVVGFRVNPGRDREAFAGLGFEPGDVVTEINGTVLDDPSRGLQVFEALGEATMANVTVIRDSVAQVLVIDTSHFQELDEEEEEGRE